MSDWYGDHPEDFATVTCMFTSSDSNGAPVAPLSAFEAGDVKIFKNGSATEKTSTNGLTMTSPFNGSVGLHCLVIDTSNDTGDSGFWTAGAVYTVLLDPDTETVNGQTVLKVLGQFGIALAGSASGPSAATIADAVWDEARSGHVAGGSFGEGVASVAGAVGSVTGLTASDVGAIKTKTDFLPSATAGSAGGVFIAGTNAATTVTTAFTTTFTGNLTGSVASVSGAVGSVTGLTAADVGAIKTKTDFLPSATAGAAGGVFIAGTNAATTVTTSLTTTFTGNLTGNVGGNVTGSVGSVAAGVTLAAGVVQSIWDALTSALTTSGSVGKLLVDNVNATISSRSTYAGGDTAGTTTLLSRLTSTRAGYLDNLSAGAVATAAAVTALPQAVWDALTSALTTVGSIGKLLVDRIDAAISSRSSQTSVDTIDGVVDDILADTAVIGAAGAGLSAIPWNAAWDAEVQSEATDALNAYDAPTHAEMTAALAALSIPSAAANAAALLATAFENAETVQDFLRLSRAVIYGNGTGMDTPDKAFRDEADSKDRIVSTQSGSDRAIVTDPS